MSAPMTTTIPIDPRLEAHPAQRRLLILVFILIGGSQLLIAGHWSQRVVAIGSFIFVLLLLLFEFGILTPRYYRLDDTGFTIRRSFFRTPVYMQWTRIDRLTTHPDALSVHTRDGRSHHIALDTRYATTLFLRRHLPRWAKAHNIVCHPSEETP